MIERMIARGLRELARTLLAAAPIVRRAGGLSRQFCARCGQSSCDGSQCGYPPAPRWSARAVRPDSHQLRGRSASLGGLVLPSDKTINEQLAENALDEQLLAPWRDVAAHEGSRL